jgi:hypothetical protein
MRCLESLLFFLIILLIVLIARRVRVSVFSHLHASTLTLLSPVQVTYLVAIVELIVDTCILNIPRPCQLKSIEDVVVA